MNAFLSPFFCPFLLKSQGFVFRLPWQSSWRSWRSWHNLGIEWMPFLSRTDCPLLEAWIQVKQSRRQFSDTREFYKRNWLQRQ